MATPTIGIDTLVGDSGDNTCIFLSSELNPGDSFDGAGGIDEVLLSGGGIFDFTLVTLTSVERIATDGSTDPVTINLVSADQATFVAAGSGLIGTNETVNIEFAIGRSTADITTFFSLFDAGAETVTTTISSAGDFFDGDLASATYNSSTDLITIVFTDSGDQPYDTSTLTYDRDGDVRSLFTVRDDGRTRDREFDEDGQLLVETLDDPTNFTTDYDEIRTTFEDGLVAQIRTIFDDGSRKVVLVDGDDGDVDDATGYVEYIREFDSNGNLDVREFVFDSSNALESRKFTYDDNGDFTEQLYVFRNDTETSIQYQGGVKAVTVNTRADNSVSVFGEDGIENTIVGSQKSDDLRGGLGADTFDFRDVKGGDDEIYDFEAGLDVLLFTGVSSVDDLEAIAAVSTVNGNLFIDFNTAALGTVTVRGVTADTLDDADLTGLAMF